MHIFYYKVTFFYHHHYHYYYILPLSPPLLYTEADHTFRLLKDSDQGMCLTVSLTYISLWFHWEPIGTARELLLLL